MFHIANRCKKKKDNTGTDNLIVGKIMCFYALFFWRKKTNETNKVKFIGTVIAWKS